MFIPQHLRLSLEVPLEGLRKPLPTVVRLRRVPLFFSPHSGQHLGLPMPGSLFDIHEGFQTVFLFDDSSLLSTEGL